MPVVSFIKLSVNNKMRSVCDLVEKCFMNNEQVIVQVADRAQGMELDKLLWTWKQNSFIPHAMLNSEISGQEEPVLITDDLKKRPSGQRLILVDATLDTDISQFAEVIDFAEIYDKARLESSRLRYKKYRDSGYAMRDMLLGEFLGDPAVAK